jgi:hypothetical protein
VKSYYFLTKIGSYPLNSRLSSFKNEKQQDDHEKKCRPISFLVLLLHGAYRGGCACRKIHASAFDDYDAMMDACCEAGVGSDVIRRRAFIPLF